MRKPKLKPNEDTQALKQSMADIGPANAYAMRMWVGQSPSLPVAERIERIMTALRDQGLIEGGEFVLDLEAFKAAGEL